MNKILPKSFEEFEQKEYWDKFFRKLKKNSDLEYFEWYGEYPNFRSIVKKYLKSSDQILNIGCGKSLMSEQMYDDGYENLVNIDFSEKVIEEMRLRSKDKRPKMVYEVMDVLKMSYKDGTYDAVIDKGTLDALFPKDTPEECAKIKTFFSEIERVINDQGSYLCISLLQEHIIRELLNHFTEKNYIIEINEFIIKKSKLFPYLVYVKKSDKPNGNNISLILTQGTVSHQLTKEQTMAKIKEIQTYSFFMSDIRKLRQGQRVSVDIWDNKQPNKVPRYTIIIVDSPNNKILEKKTCGCFISPQGRESSYIVGTEQGNFELLAQTNMSRLLIVILNPGHKFSDMEEIQAELSGIVPNLSPKDCKNSIPFMTDGDEIGERVILFEDDDMFIEEHKNEEGMGYRSLILKANLNQIQSENRLKYYDAEERSKAFPLAAAISKKSLLEPRKGKIVGPDESYLTFEFHRLMIAGLGLVGKRVIEANPLRVLILGGGAGILSKFFYYNFPNSKIDTVEINNNIIKTCKIYFEWPNDVRFNVVKGDAIEFVKNAAATVASITAIPKEEGEQAKPEEEKEEKEEKKTSEPDLYDVIIMDISDPSGKNISPPSDFRQSEFLQSLKSILRPAGMSIINTIVPDNSKLDSVLKEFNKVFDVLYLAKAEEELNHVVYAMNIDFKKDKQNEQEIVIVEPEKLMGRKELDISFKQIVKGLSTKWDPTMNIESYCSSISLKYPQINANPLQMTNAVMTKNNEEFTNRTKELYLDDKEKVTKEKRKKKKNKN